MIEVGGGVNGELLQHYSWLIDQHDYSVPKKGKRWSCEDEDTSPKMCQ